MNYSIAKYKDTIYKDYFVTKDGQVFKGRNPVRIFPVGNRPYVDIYYRYAQPPARRRIDQLVAYTFLEKPEDAIRLLHIDGDNWNCKLDNLRWYTKRDLLQSYIDQCLINPDGTVSEMWQPVDLPYNPTLRYEVSNLGNLRDATTKELIQQFTAHDYKVIYYLHYESKVTKIMGVHRLVAEAFIPNPNNYNIVNHIDGNKSNNLITNLEWCSTGMNSEHSYLTKTKYRGYTAQQIHDVCKLLTYRKISQVDISNITGVDKKTVSDVLRGRRWKDISDSYEFPVKLWNASMREEICSLILEGKKGKEIFQQLDMPYDGKAVSFYERMRAKLIKEGKLK